MGIEGLVVDTRELEQLEVVAGRVQYTACSPDIELVLRRQLLDHWLAQILHDQVCNFLLLHDACKDIQQLGLV
jgi:hypothetical protein